MISWLQRGLLLVVAAVVAAALRVLRWTWRVEIVGARPDGARLVAFWHGDLLALSAVCPPGTTVLISRSRDGSLATRVARGLDLQIVRGSTSAGAVPGALELARRLRRGAVVALAADGPRGPRHRAGAGVTRLAAIGRTRAVAVAAMARRGWRLSTWDRLLVPAPFSAVRVVWGAAFADEAQGALQEARRRARGWVGVT